MLSTPLLIRQYLYFCVQSVRTRDSPTFYLTFYIWRSFLLFLSFTFFGTIRFHLPAKKKRVEGCWVGRRDVLWVVRCSAIRPVRSLESRREEGEEGEGEVLTGWGPEGNWP
jgi:hypothetical protein